MAFLKIHQIDIAKSNLELYVYLGIYFKKKLKIITNVLNCIIFFEKCFFSPESNVDLFNKID